MKRRDFILLTGGASLAQLFAAHAQQSTPRTRRIIGILQGAASSNADAQTDVAALLRALESLGWKVSDNLTVELRWAAGDARLAETYARELVGLAPDVIVSVGSSPIVELHKTTRTVPIVFARVSDPVGLGIVSNLARPAGNITGFSNFELSVGSKWLQLLKEIAPAVTRVAVIGNPKTSSLDGYFKSIAAVSKSLAVESSIAAVQSADEIERLIAGVGAKASAGLVVVPDGFLLSHRAVTIAAAAKYRVPAIYPFRFYAAEGGLLSYGINTIEQFKRAASYVDRILRGAKPADLPVQAPTEFELVINMKTAKALGIAVPQSILLRADRLIE